MKKKDFQFYLPDELIAQFPAESRSASRLLCLNGQDGAISHRYFTDILDLLHPEDLLVLNDTKVIPARTYGVRPTGGIVEIMLERILSPTRISAHLKASNTPKAGLTMTLVDGSHTIIQARDGDLFLLDLLDKEKSWRGVLEEIGTMPLPPYINRESQDRDFERYQTVYANQAGSVAAPTAGLHFDHEIIRRINQKGVEQAFVTLHVGAGTFQPVRTDNIMDHVMHSEQILVSQSLCEKVRATKKRGGRIIAVGTTSVRCLETAWHGQEIEPYFGETDIFIMPGYQFNCVDAMITNFHLPESTLLMLVSAFAGIENIRKAYREAIEKKYRFYSYGDAMFLQRQQKEEV